MLDREIRVADRLIGGGHPCFVVAEIGSNHNRDLHMAKELIAAAVEAGADAVKFQSQALEEQYLAARETPEFIDFFRKTELPEDWYQVLWAEGVKRGTIIFSSPTYLRAIDLLEAQNVAVYKIASPQVATYPALVRRAAQTGKPMIVSAGMVTYPDLTRVVETCLAEGNRAVVILHCVSRYPTAPADVNLRTMETYRAMFGGAVGFSDHTEGYHISVAATALGAAVLEKHITLDRRLPGPDHAFALEPSDFAAMVRAIRDAESSLGSSARLSLPDDVQAFVRHIDMRLVAARDIDAGEVLEPSLFVHRRTREGISVSDLARLANAVAARRITAGSVVHWDDVVLSRSA
jgi:sialic acid synthase SpsE